MDQDKIDDWKERIKGDGAMIMLALEWAIYEDVLTRDRHLTTTGKCLDEVPLEDKVHENICDAVSVSFLPTSKEMNGIHDLFKEIIDAYAEHRANEEENDVAEKKHEDKLFRSKTDIAKRRL